jgi:glutathione peroxidase
MLMVEEQSMNIYDIKVLDNKEQEVSLSQYKGKTLLIVNTATKCGFTPQYKGLQELYKKYQDKGFVILDFPCNQFLFQAPGSDEELEKFATINYGTTFSRFHKIDVNGKNESPLYTYLKSQKTGRIKWNFTKFLIDKDGNVVERYDSAVKPEEIDAAIEKLVGAGSEVQGEVKKITTLTLADLDGCPHCATAKLYLNKFGIKYDELNWSHEENDATFKALDIEAVPVLLIPENGGLTKIKGEDEIGKWARSQKK